MDIKERAYYAWVTIIKMYSVGKYHNYESLAVVRHIYEIICFNPHFNKYLNPCSDKFFCEESSYLSYHGKRSHFYYDNLILHNKRCHFCKMYTPINRTMYKYYFNEDRVYTMNMCLLCKNALFQKKILNFIGLKLIPKELVEHVLVEMLI